MSFLQPPFFDENFNGQGDIPGLMPLFHTCDCYFLNEIMRRQEIKTHSCDAFDKEDLLYLFYGKPAYKSIFEGERELKSHMPITFIINPDSIGEMKRVFPFDSGAFKSGMFKDHMHSAMRDNDFLMNATIPAITKTVGFFYENNTQYFKKSPREIVNYDVHAYVIESYLSLIKTKSNQETDDRKACIEVQLDHGLALSSQTLLGVILPAELMLNRDIRSFFEDEMRIEPLTYETFGMGGKHHYTNILTKTLEYLTKNKYCHVN